MTGRLEKRAWVGLLTAVLALLTTALPAAAERAEAPRLERRDSVLHLRAPRTLLDLTPIESHLDSGLTTTFVFRVEVKDTARHRAQGVVVVEVRYEAWDEVYQVAAGGPVGGLEPTTLDSRAALSDWWQELVLPVVEAADLESESTWRVTVDLKVHPFSTLERDQARRWFVDSLDPAESGNAEAVESAAGERREPLSDLVKGFLASSIQRDAVYIERWKLTLPVGVAE